VEKKTIMLAIIISTLLFSAVAGAKLVNSGRANPFMPSGSWSDEPIPPSIDVQSPSETLHYWTESDVWLNFTVTAPRTSWYSTMMNPYPDNYAITYGNVTQVRFSLDRKAETITDKISEYQGVLSFSVKLERLSIGRHDITIYAEGFARYRNLTHDVYVGSEYSFKDSAITKLVETSIDVSFIVADAPPANIPLEQLNEEDELKAPIEPQAEESLPIKLIIGFIAIVVVGAGLLIYFKKCKR